MSAATVIGTCQIAPDVQLSPGAVVGKAFRPLQNGANDGSGGVSIGDSVYVGVGAVIGARTRVGPKVSIDDGCIVETDCEIGARTLLIYRAQVCAEAVVGEDCVIGGFVAERVIVGDGCRVFGKVVHSHRDPTKGWDDEASTEPSAEISPRAFIGFDALVIGGVKIGANAYVAAGALVTRDVPAGHIAFGVNNIVAPEQWSGRLSGSPLFAPTSK